MKKIVRVSILFLAGLTSFCNNSSDSASSSACSAFSTVISDDFNRGNSTGLGGNWTMDYGTSGATMNVSSNAGAAIRGSNNANAYYNQPMSDSCIRLSAKTTIPAAGTRRELFLFARTDGTANNGYGAGADESNLIIYRFASGSSAMMVNSAGGLNLSTPYGIEFLLNGSALTLNLKDGSGSLIKSINTTDTTYSAGKPGIRAGSSSPNIQTFDDFKVEKGI